MPYKDPIRRKKYIKKYNDQNKQKISKYQKEYYEKFPWKRTLKNIKTRCENPKFKQYHDYGGRGIECKITEEELEELWYRDKAYLMEKPTIDRKDNDRHYELDNCRFIEKSLNSSKDKRKPILQYDLNGNFIREWESATEAEIISNICQGAINSCLKNRSKTSGGFKWRYKTCLK